MSEVVGWMLIQVGVVCLEKLKGGVGVLFGGVFGVVLGKVIIFGGGVVGYNVVWIVVGFGVEVIVIDCLFDWLCWFDNQFGNWIYMLYLIVEVIEVSIIDVDLIIGVVLIFGVVMLYLICCE